MAALRPALIVVSTEEKKLIMAWSFLFVPVFRRYFFLPLLLWLTCGENAQQNIIYRNMSSIGKDFLKQLSAEVNGGAYIY